MESFWTRNYCPRLLPPDLNPLRFFAKNEERGIPCADFQLFRTVFRSTRAPKCGCYLQNIDGVPVTVSKNEDGEYVGTLASGSSC